MPRDPYTVLGVPKSASETEIKRAFRKAAKANHPDTKPDDVRARERFTEANQAYEILGDKEKRRQFDAGEIDAEGKPSFKGFGGFGGGGGGGGARGGGFENVDPRDFANMFSQFGFGRGARGRTGGRATGTGTGGAGASQDTRFRFSTGNKSYESSEGGFSQEDILRGLFAGGLGAGAASAPGPGSGASSAGNGDLEASVAVTLEDIASGARPKVTLPNGRTLQISLPQGVGDGQVIRLKGQGQPGGGDALVTIRFVPHPRFRVDGADLLVSADVPLEDAVLGGKVTVPTLTGQVRLTVPPMSSGGRQMRLKGKGLPDRDGAGDLIATLQITLPERMTDELKALMERLRAAAGVA